MLKTKATKTNNLVYYEAAELVLKAVNDTR